MTKEQLIIAEVMADYLVEPEPEDDLSEELENLLKGFFIPARRVYKRAGSDLGCQPATYTGGSWQGRDRKIKKC